MPKYRSMCGKMASLDYTEKQQQQDRPILSMVHILFDFGRTLELCNCHCIRITFCIMGNSCQVLLLSASPPTPIKFFGEHYQSVKRFGFLITTLMRIYSGSQLEDIFGYDLPRTCICHGVFYMG